MVLEKGCNCMVLEKGLLELPGTGKGTYYMVLEKGLVAWYCKTTSCMVVLEKGLVIWYWKND